MNPFKLFTAWRAWQTLRRAFEEYRMSREPVMITQIVSAGAVIVGLFGFHLSAEQIASIAVVVGLVMGLVARARVTPVAP